MKTLITFSLLGAVCATAFAQSTSLTSMDDLRKAAVPVPEVQTPAPLRRSIKTVVGEPSSSLTRAQALECAQELASRITDAAVAELAAAYDGKMAPAIPMNCILVIEPATFATLRPFDIAIYTAPNKEIRARRLLSKTTDRAVVGYEYNDITPTEVAPSAFVGRVVATVLFDPTSPATK